MHCHPTLEASLAKQIKYTNLSAVLLGNAGAAHDHMRGAANKYYKQLRRPPSLFSTKACSFWLASTLSILKAEMETLQSLAATSSSVGRIFVPQASASCTNGRLIPRAALTFPGNILEKTNWKSSAVEHAVLRDGKLTFCFTTSQWRKPGKG